MPPAAIAEMLDGARDDFLAFAGFPTAHWRQIWSTNLLERVNKEPPVTGMPIDACG